MNMVTAIFNAIVANSRFGAIGRALYGEGGLCVPSLTINNTGELIFTATEIQWRFTPSVFMRERADRARIHLASVFPPVLEEIVRGYIGPDSTLGTPQRRTFNVDSNVYRRATYPD
jgi:hypothetical protein